MRRNTDHIHSQHDGTRACAGHGFHGRACTDTWLATCERRNLCAVAATTRPPPLAAAECSGNARTSAPYSRAGICCGVRKTDRRRNSVTTRQCGRSHRSFSCCATHRRLLTPARLEPPRVRASSCRNHRALDQIAREHAPCHRDR